MTNEVPFTLLFTLFCEAAAVEPHTSLEPTDVGTETYSTHYTTFVHTAWLVIIRQTLNENSFDFGHFSFNTPNLTHYCSFLLNQGMTMVK